MSDQRQALTALHVAFDREIGKAFANFAARLGRHSTELDEAISGQFKDNVARIIRARSVAARLIAEAAPND